MAIQRMDHVGVVADDLEAAIAFFAELGLQLDGETTVEGRSPSSSAEPPPTGDRPARSRPESSYLTDRGSTPTVRPPETGETSGKLITDSPPLALPEGRPAPR